MKHYYFMNKAEVVDAEDYENPDGYAKFHYTREDRLARRRKPAGCDETQPTNSFFGKRKKKRKRSLYLVDALILIAMFGYWKYGPHNKVELQEKVVDNNWQYHLKLTRPSSGRRELIVYLKNNSHNSRKLNKKYTLTFYYSNDKKSYKVKPVTHEVNRSFNPGEAISLGSSSFSHEKSVNYDKVGVIINKSFNLEKALHKK